MGSLPESDRVARASRHVGGTAGRFLLATDGGPDALGAVAVAAAFARAEAEIRALTVIPFPPTGMAGAESTAFGAAADAEIAAEHATLHSARESVRDQLSAGALEADLRVVQGRVVSTIVRSAREWDARMILIGLHRHPLLDRLMGEETTLRVARSSNIPVFAATAGASGIPRRMLVAVDFSAASLRAARTVLEFASDGAHITLVHVRSALGTSRPTPDESPHYTAGIASGMEQLQRSLSVPDHCRLDSVTLIGEPAVELLRFATQERADVIAVGSHRHSLVGRMALGSVTTDLLRAATHPVLVIPPETSRAA